MSKVYGNHNTARRVFCRWSLRPAQEGHPVHCPDGCPTSSVVELNETAADLGHLVEALERAPATPVVTRAAEARVSVLGAGGLAGAYAVPDGQLGIYLGDPGVGTFLVEGTLAELQAWVEHLRWQVLDIPTVAMCLHCKREISMQHPGQPWRDIAGLVECQQRRGALTHEPTEREVVR